MNMKINNDDNEEPASRRVVKYTLAALIFVALFLINYHYFSRHISSNPEKIVNFIKEEPVAKFRNPAVAGIFYPYEPEALNSELNKHLGASVPRHFLQPQILVVPHAGYRYSAATAAKAYQVLQAYSGNIRNVILVGPAHYVHVKGAAVPKNEYWTTPLGKIALNRQIINNLVSDSGFVYNDKAHKKEHSLEVQLPFLQKVLKNFQIAPVVYGDVSPETLAKALEPYLKRPDTLIIFSADLSHYYDDATAKIIDSQTEEMVAAGKAEIESHMSCGAPGINAAILLARKAGLRPTLLDMRNSGAAGGDKSGVVGYGAWSFTDAEMHKDDKPLSSLEQEWESLRNFAGLYGKDILKIAGEAVNEAVLNKGYYKPTRKEYDNNLFNRGAAFVTINKNGKLRGCMGSLLANQAIAFDVAQNAYSAALEDNRFSPLTKEDLKDITLSVSLLTGFERINYKDEQDLLSRLKPGADGLVIRAGNRQGVFLPSVWKELPERADFLNNLKVKAGMTPSFWSNNIKVYRFRAVEISKDEN